MGSLGRVIPSELLIVPEGIEIMLWALTSWADRLLIVPEGIEIWSTVLSLMQQMSFNRTRRNWNWVIGSLSSKSSRTFNRTRRNWNWSRPRRPLSGYGLLIVPEGIEITLSLFERLPSPSFNRTRRNWNLGTVVAPPGNTTLLIVPEGIEMDEVNGWPEAEVITFNRTRRNWNADMPELQGLEDLLLIVPEGIEIRSRLIFLRTLLVF